LNLYSGCSSEDDVDLEDGEIEDEGDSSQAAPPAPVVSSTPSKPITPRNHESVRSPPGWIRNSPREFPPNSGGSLLGMRPNPRMKKTPRPMHNIDRGKPWPPMKNSKVSEEPDDDDWAKNLENKLQEVINRDNVSKNSQVQPQGSPPNQDSGKEDDDYQRGRRKKKRKKQRDEEGERGSHEGKVCTCSSCRK